MAKAPNPTAKPAVKTVKGLRVQSTVDGFRRAGRPWSRESVDVPLSEFNKDQIDQLRAEKMLVVVDVDIEIPAEEQDEAAE